MAEHSHTGGLVFLSFVLGATVGAIAGILFAPKAGKETREDIAGAATEVKKEAEKFTKEAMNRIEGFVADSKIALNKLTTKERA